MAVRSRGMFSAISAARYKLSRRPLFPLSFFRGCRNYREKRLGSSINGSSMGIAVLNPFWILSTPHSTAVQFNNLRNQLLRIALL